MVRLVRAELSLIDAALAGDHALTEVLGHHVVPGWATFTEALRPTREALVADPTGSVWGGRLFVAGGGMLLAQGSALLRVVPRRCGHARCCAR